MLRRLIPVFTLCLLTFPAFCQSASKCQVATITEVKAHPAAGDDASDPISYDVSVKVDDTIYRGAVHNTGGRNRPRNTQPGASSWCWSERTPLPTTTCWAGLFKCQ